MSANGTTLTALGDGGDATRVLAGDCTVTYDGDRREEHRGHVTVLVKPDNTVLVHDATGYQPVAWLTRADAVTCTRDVPRSRLGVQAPTGSAGPAGDRAPDADAASASGAATGSTSSSAAEAAVDTPAGAGTSATIDAADADASADPGRTAFAVDARDGDARLLVRSHTEDGYVAFPTTRAGRPVGTCPDCSGTLVRVAGAVACVGCGAEHGLPDGATVRDVRCDCGHPRLRVERGAPLDVCLDRTCEPLVEAVRERFDRAWDCPRCGSDLRVLRRGGLLAGCETYPDCEASFPIPVGTVVDDCDCGLPVFETARGRRCLDTDCERATAGG